MKAAHKKKAVVPPAERQLFDRRMELFILFSQEIVTTEQYEDYDGERWEADMKSIFPVYGLSEVNQPCRRTEFAQYGNIVFTRIVPSL
ncbi:MAG: hypothetical protein VB055_07405 [Oscillospiraceae bacterium]|nr:hypothetical protein [Oscillospiraceae bacterium]